MIKLTVTAINITDPSYPWEPLPGIAPVEPIPQLPMPEPLPGYVATDPIYKL